MSENSRSGWFYVFVGCGVLLLGGILLIGIGSVMAVRWGNNLKQELEDPVARSANARELLSADELPAGYYAAVHVKLPLGLGRMVVLSDGEPSDRPGDISDGEHVFFYMEGPGWDSDWKKFANGGDPDFDNLDELNVNVSNSGRLSTGSLTVGKMDVHYTSNRGEVSGEGFQSDEGVFSILLVRCPDGDKRSRTIIWSGPPAPEGAGDPLTGTTGDPQRIGAMLANFSLCG